MALKEVRSAIFLAGDVTPAVWDVAICLSPNRADGDIAHTGQARPDRAPMQAILVIAHIAYAEETVLYGPSAAQECIDHSGSDAFLG